MNILELHELNKQQKAEIENLVRECLELEGLERTIYLDNDINFYVDLNSFYLLYDKGRLVSVLTVLQPLEEEAEITAYTLPAERKKGYFKALFQRAEEELLSFGISRILFVAEPKSVSGISALKALDAVYYKSEYLLAYPFPEASINNTMYFSAPDFQPLFELIEITRERQEEAAVLGSEIFCTDVEETQDVIEIAMNSEFMKCYGAYLENKLIGICSISYGTTQASIFGFGIAPGCQGRGYGRRLLKQVMNMLRNKGTEVITLHVGSENARAYSLYTSVGFKIQTQYDYYESGMRKDI